MTQRDRSPENTSSRGRPDHPVETAAELAASLARIRREALERVTAHHQGSSDWSITAERRTE